MSVEPKSPDRVRQMDAYLKETQAFAIQFRLGILSREEWREWLRQEYNVPLAPPIRLDGVPDMSNIEGMPEFVQALVDGRLAELFEAEESPEERAAAEQNGGAAPESPEPPELTDEVLQRLAEEGE